MPTARQHREPWSDDDRRMMDRAIALARRGVGRVEPNPMVGCVIARDGRVIGEGFHQRFGGPHAEVHALRSCRRSPRGATVYVSLEPCCHFGKTPPCTSALIDAGVARVVAAVRDPNPTVGGRGLAILRGAGITVQTGLRQEAASEIIAPFCTLITQHRPFVIAKWAQSLDGKLAAPSGGPRWISSEDSRHHAHRLRARVDAVIVGSGTVLADDPRLTARNVGIRRRATRVVLDGRLRTPERSRLVTTAQRVPTMVFTTRMAARSAKADRLRGRGVEIVAVAAHGRRLSVRQCLRSLADRAMTNVLVEGGPTLLTSFLAAGLVDEAWVFVAPLVLGEDGLPGPTLRHGAQRARGADRPPVRLTRCGPDILCRMVLRRETGVRRK